MSIVSSTHEIGNLQACGRYRVVETHVDHLGTEYRRDYLADPAADHVAIRAGTAAQLEYSLAESEAVQVVS